MTAKIVRQKEDWVIIQWDDDEIGFGELRMHWDSRSNRYILDAEMMGIDTVIKIFQSLENSYEKSV